MSMDDIIAKKIISEFTPSYYSVVNESHNHAGTKTQSHYKIVVVSDVFNGLNLINRHRAINKTFKKELTQIHALAIHTYTKQEWSKKGYAPESPKCTNNKQ